MTGRNINECKNVPLKLVSETMLRVKEKKKRTAEDRFKSNLAQPSPAQPKKSRLQEETKREEPWTTSFSKKQSSYLILLLTKLQKELFNSFAFQKLQFTNHVY